MFAVPTELSDKLQWQGGVVRDAARWLGRVTWAATNDNCSGGRDSVASKAAADAVRRRRSSNNTVRPEHDKAPKQAAWRRRSQEEKTAEWASKAAEDGPAIRHQLMMSGPVVWCNVCGAFGSQRPRSGSLVSWPDAGDWHRRKGPATQAAASRLPPQGSSQVARRRASCRLVGR